MHEYSIYKIISKNQRFEFCSCKLHLKKLNGFIKNEHMSY